MSLYMKIKMKCARKNLKQKLEEKGIIKRQELKIIYIKEHLIKKISKIEKVLKNTEVKEIQSQKGITLLVLVVTIIVLLILAGITIGALTGKNGIINNSKMAKEETEIANEKGILEKSTVEAMAKNKYGNIEETELQNELNRKTGDGKTEIASTGEEFEVLFIESNRYYTVDKDGNVGEAQEFIQDKYPGNITVGKDGKILDGNSEETAYQIWCIEDLMEWSKNYSQYMNSYIKLCTNLNFKSELSYANSETKDYGDVNQDNNTDALIKELQTGEGFKPIQQFSGTFNGNDYTINNLYISKQDNAGFIIYLSNAVLKSITIKGEVYSESKYAGIIAQAGNSQFENIISDIEIYGGTGAGIIGNCTGKLNIKKCNNIGNIESTSAVGGICGDMFRGEILNCMNQGTIKSSESNNYGVGGLCGNDGGDCIIKNSINIGTVIYDGRKGVWYFGGTGGMIGLNRQTLTIQNCVNVGKIESTSYAGAICGMELTYWKSQKKYDLVNSFMLNNVELVTGSIQTDTSATIFEIDDIQDVIASLNKYINDNNLTEQGWIKWKLGENGYPVFE